MARSSTFLICAFGFSLIVIVDLIMTGLTVAAGEWLHPQLMQHWIVNPFLAAFFWIKALQE